MFMIGTINMEMNGPCKYMYMYFFGEKGSLYNLYDGVLEYLCNATCTCIPPNNLTKDTYQEIKNFIGTIFTGNRDICLSLFGSYILQFLYQ